MPDISTPSSWGQSHKPIQIPILILDFIICEMSPYYGLHWHTGLRGTRPSRWGYVQVRTIDLESFLVGSILRSLDSHSTRGNRRGGMRVEKGEPITGVHLLQFGR